MHLRGVCSGLLSFLALMSLVACTEANSHNKGKAKAERPPAPVEAAAVAAQDVPVLLTAVGNVEPYATVVIKSLVSGQIVSVHFTEGQEVNQGDPLFTVDKAPFEVALKESQARLARDAALLRKAQDDVRRNEGLAQKDYVSRQNYDQLVATAQSLEATVKADQAAVDQAQLNLGYCSIRSPISGRTGTILINRGNLVKANDDNKFLVTIHQVQPIYVSFAVPESRLAEITQASRSAKLKVRAVIPQQAGDKPVPPREGELSFIDNTVDKSTGTIRLKASFPNEDRLLWPGQFVNATLTLGVERAALTVPDHAVQTGQKGPFVYVIRPDSTAEVRPVKVGRLVSGQAVIAEGLKAGEQVVTNGHLLLTPNAKVQVKPGVGGPGKPAPAEEKKAGQAKSAS